MGAINTTEKGKRICWEIELKPNWWEGQETKLKLSQQNKENTILIQQVVGVSEPALLKVKLPQVISELQMNEQPDLVTPLRRRDNSLLQLDKAQGSKAPGFGRALGSRRLVQVLGLHYWLPFV